MMAEGAGRRPYRHRGVRAAVAALLMSGALAACTPVTDTRAEPYEPAVSPIEAVQTLGQIALPTWPEIIGLSSDSGADTRYRIAMRLDGGQAQEFLSQFPVGPAPSQIPRSMSVTGGPTLDSAPDPLYLQDVVPSAEGTFMREIVVDERGPDEIYVHVSVFTV